MMEPQIIRGFLATLRKTQSMPAAQMLRYQRELLERVVRHAHEHVPFYRDSARLAPLFRADGAIDWKQWETIPLLTRREVQRAGSALHAVELPAQHGRTWTLPTSGSTGEPVQILHSEFTAAAWAALMLRALEWYEVDPTRRFARVGTFPHQESAAVAPRSHNAWYTVFEHIGLCGERLDVPEILGAARIIDELVSFRPICVSLNAVELGLLCGWDRDRRLRALGPITVMTSADRLAPATKQTVQEQYGWRVLDLYASQECGLIATLCPLCDRFHAHSESIFLELRDDDGAMAQPGRPGWVVATPLYNFAMPLIRYDHADQASYAIDKPCTVTLPSLQNVLGKEPTLFTFSGGVTVRPVVPPSQVIEFLGAQAFQVAQVAEDRCEFRIVPGTLAPAAMRFDEMTDQLRKRWWPGLKVDYRILDQLPGSGSRRKTRLFVREMPPDSAPTPAADGAGNPSESHDR